jgi:hypothetical protein
MTDVTQGNDPTARTATGEMVDQTPKTETKDTTGSNQDQTNQNDQTKKDSPDPKIDDQSKSTDAKSKSPLNDDKEGEKKEEPKGAPEKYEAFKVPEGFTLDEAVATEAGTLFKDLGLSQDQAQKLVDFHVAKSQEAFDAPFKVWEDQQNTWRKEVADDAQLGPRLPEIKANFSRMLDSVGDPAAATAFREMMEFTGAGNNPAFIRMMDKISSHFAEGKPLSGGKPAPVNEPGRASGPGPQAMYPGLK